MAKNPFLAKKQEERNLEKIKELLKLPENKKCFDCPTRSPFFVNLSIQTFICARCSGLVREVGHRIKSISTSKFSDAEVVALQCTGNQVARTIWLSKLLFNQDDEGEPETDGDVRLFMRQKYYEQKWLDREKAVLHVNYIRKVLAEKMVTTHGDQKNSSSSSNRDKTVVTVATGADAIPDNTRRMSLINKINVTQQTASPLSLSTASRPNLIDIDDFTITSPITPTSPTQDGYANSSSNNRSPSQSTPSWDDEQVPIGLIPSIRSAAMSSNIRNNASNEDLLSFNNTDAPTTSSTTFPKSNISSVHSLSQTTSSVLPLSPTPSNHSSKHSDSIFKDLADLHHTVNFKYTSENVLLQPTNRTSNSNYSLTSSSSLSSIATELSSPSLSATYNHQQHINSTDPYAILRSVSSSSNTTLQNKKAPTKKQTSDNLFRDLDPLFNKNLY